LSRVAQELLIADAIIHQQEANMASLPLNIAPAAAGGPAVTFEADSPIKGGAGDADADHRAAGPSFPTLMKKAAPSKDKKPTAEEALLAMTAAPLPPAPDNAAPLPAAGMVLPPALPQHVDTIPVQAGAAAPAPAQAQPGGRLGTASIVAALAGGTAAAKADGAAVEASPSSQAGGDNGKTPVDRFAADMAARFVLPAQVMAYGSPDGHQDAQGLLKELNGALIGDHAGDGKAAPTADGLTSNQGAGALLQSGDKLPAAAPTNTVISVPLSHHDWSDELSNRVSWMIHQEVQTASVKLNPPHLGPLEVQVSLANDQVNVSFTTHHALVRDALDASMPRLRDMLGNSGLQLGDANVTHHSYSNSNQQQSGQQSSGYGGHGGGAADYTGPSDVLLSARHQPLYYVGDGAIDLYA
jgi:flagellar hook-length control protein FliK